MSEGVPVALIRLGRSGLRPVLGQQQADPVPAGTAGEKSEAEKRAAAQAGDKCMHFFLL